MSTLIDDIRKRKDFGPGMAAPSGVGLAYTDPESAVTERADDITWFVVSTEDVDRDGDVVRSGGWDVDHFLRAGAPWLFDHGEHDSRPIGKAVHPGTGEPLLRVERGRTLAGICWDSGPWGQEVKGLVDRGMVNTASIGFLPKSGHPRTRPAGMNGKAKPAWDIDELEILELTITPTPANPNAMKLAIDKGELSPVVLKSFRKALGALADTAGGTLVGDDKDEEKHVDDGTAELKSALEDCVGRKVKILVDEGKDEKQALAIAYSMCGEEHAKAMEAETPERMEKDKSKKPCPNCTGTSKNGKVSRMDTATKAADTADDEPDNTAEEAKAEDNPGAEDGGDIEPHGVTVSRNLLEHLKAGLDYLCQHGLPGMEPDSEMGKYLDEELKPLLHEIATALHEKAGEIYEDHDIGEAPEPLPDDGNEGEEEEVSDSDEAPEEEDKAEDTPEGDDSEQDSGTKEEEKGEAPSKSGEDEDEDMDEDEEKALADRYARKSKWLRKSWKRKAYRMAKASKSVCMKAVGCMTKAADHLDESSEDEGVPEEKGYMHKGHAAMLRKSADELTKAIGGETEGGDQEDMPKNGEGGGDMPEENPEKGKSVDWALVLGEVRGMRKALDKARGRQ